MKIGYCMSLLFNCRFKERSLHRLVNDLAADLAIPSIHSVTQSLGDPATVGRAATVATRLVAIPSSSWSLVAGRLLVLSLAAVLLAL